MRQIGSQGIRGRADHPSANVRRETLTRAPQISGVDARQVVSPKAELSHREQAGGEHSPFQYTQTAFTQVPGGQQREHERNEYQSGQLENPQ